MNRPPLGYDDESIVPQKRLTLLLGELEREFTKVQRLFHSHLSPSSSTQTAGVEERFWSLRTSAEELGSEYAFLVEKLIADYEHFKRAPSQEQLDTLFSDLKSLQLLVSV